MSLRLAKANKQTTAFCIYSGWQGIHMDYALKPGRLDGIIFLRPCLIGGVELCCTAVYIYIYISLVLHCEANGIHRLLDNTEDRCTCHTVYI